MTIIDFPGHDEMNKTTRRLILSLYFLIFSINANVTGQMLSLRAPELFGTAPAYMLRSGSRFYGLVLAPGAVFAFQGIAGDRELRCTIWQIAGKPIQGEFGFPGSERPIACGGIIRGGKWIGWIDFRGHERAFCAAASADQLPRSCRLKR